MILEILKYRLVCDVAAGSAEVAPRPEMATPVTFAKFWELHLNAMRRADDHFTESVYDQKTAKASLRLKTKVWNQKRDNKKTGVASLCSHGGGCYPAGALRLTN